MAKIQITSFDPRDLVKTTVETDDVNLFKKLLEEDKPFESNVWIPKTSFTLKQFAEHFDPRYKNVKAAYVVAHRRNDNGKIFHKIKVVLGETKTVEWEFSYRKRVTYEENDEIDVSTLLFCIEECDGKYHKYAFGDLL